MYLSVPTQADGAAAWLEAVRLVDKCHGREAHNVIIDVQDPGESKILRSAILQNVEAFLGTHGKSVESIANTIFPQALYLRHGAAKFTSIFHDRVLPKVRLKQRWSGYYFERMTREENQLGEIIARMRDPKNRSKNKFELSLFDPKSDIDGSPYGGQCLSFLSFHLLAGSPRTLLLTAQYRNHYYIEKLLGNLLGLGRLMSYVASEAGLKSGSLTVVSTHAIIDCPGSSTRQNVLDLISHCATSR